jgi:hypothetical protein
MVVVVAESSPGSGSAPSLTHAQTKQLRRIAAGYQRSKATVIRAFEPEVAVPRNQRWHAAELAEQKALAKLSAALPTGACRTAIDAMIAHEKTRNPIRQKLIDDYAKRRLGLVATDTVNYAITVPRLRELRDQVLAACGVAVEDATRSAPVDPARVPLTTEQAKLMAAVQRADDVVDEKFAKAFSLPEFVKDVQKLDRADAPVTEDLANLVGQLPDSACKSALDAVLALEQQQAVLRGDVIAAGRANDLTTVIVKLIAYAKINASSSTSIAARRTATRACAVKL